MVRLACDDLARKHGEARRAARGEAQAADLLAWGRRYLPAHFSRPPSLLHRWLAEALQTLRGQRGSWLNVLGPRGSAKSTVGTLAFALRARAGRLGAVPLDRLRHAAPGLRHLENIKAELLDNRLLAADYPQAAGRGPVWRTGAIVLRNGAAIEAFGTGQGIRGRRHGAHRPTLILCDDLQNDGHIQSALQREHSRSWFHGTLMKAGTPRTNVVNLATALHREALAMELHRQPGWRSRIFKAIQRWPDNMALWQQWEALYVDVENPRYRRTAQIFYQQHRRAMDAGAIVLWPEEEDLYTLMCMRAEGGRAAFEREKQNSPINPDLCEWPETYFDEGIWFDDWPENLQVKTLALDPSKGSDARRGDYSALVMLGVDREGSLYLEADLARRPTPQIVADGVELCRRFGPDVFGVEANQFQDLLCGEFEAEFRRQGVLGTRPWPLENRANKLVRIRRLGPYLSARRLRFKSASAGTRLLVEQLRQFPVGDHDDGPDAAEMALRLAAELLEGRQGAARQPQRIPLG